jgi:undecaprenyl-diphosphatase
MQTYFSSADAFKRFAVRVVWATFLTGVVGEGLIKVIEHTLFKGQPKAVIEDLFGRLDLVAPALACAGILILIAGLREKKGEVASEKEAATSLTGSITRRQSGNVTMAQAGWMGFVQGLALPFRGFSRSGVTISAGMLTGAAKERAERFSFAMAVVITPLAIGREGLRLLQQKHEYAAAGIPLDLHRIGVSSLEGALFAFLAGLVALKWLSDWLEMGRWYLFGIYCLVASGVVWWLHFGPCHL